MTSRTTEISWPPTANSEPENGQCNRITLAQLRKQIGVLQNATEGVSVSNFQGTHYFISSQNYGAKERYGRTKSVTSVSVEMRIRQRKLGKLLRPSS